MFTTIKRKATDKIARLILAASVIFILIGTPTMPVIHAADCGSGSSSSSCSG
jgi:hypothetical protein